MQAVARKLVGGDVVPDVAGACGLGKQVPDHVMEVLLRSRDLLVTTWGLFRHYWVLAKLLINVFATIVLLMYTQTVSYLAGVAAGTTPSSADLRDLRGPTFVLHAGGALLLLLVATVLGGSTSRGA